MGAAAPTVAVGSDAVQRYLRRTHAYPGSTPGAPREYPVSTRSVLARVCVGVCAVCVCVWLGVCASVGVCVCVCVCVCV